MAQDVNRPVAVKVIYGLFIVMPILTLMRDHPPSAGRAVVVVLGTTLIFTFAETYAVMVGAMLHQKRWLNRKEILKIWRHEAPMLVGTQPPTVVLILSALGFLPADQAIDNALWVLVLFLFGYGLWVGHILHVQPLLQLLSGLLLVGLAYIIVAFKALPLFH